MPWHTIDGGGVTRSTGGDYTLFGTVGQPDATASILTDGEYRLTAGIWAVQPLRPPCFVQELAGFPNPEPDSESSYHGDSVAINGNHALAGVPLNDTNGDDSGCAFAYRFDGSAWVQLPKLVPLDGDAGDQFGCSVALDGYTALIGAEWDEGVDCSGSVYVFEFNGSIWQQVQKLIPSDHAWPSGCQLFGGAVAIEGDTALIGAIRDDDTDFFAGAVYVFRHDGATWVEQTKLLPGDGGWRHYFGCSVDVSGEKALIGAYGYDSYRGAAYVFYRDDNGTPNDPSDDSWSEQDKLLAAGGAQEDYFGGSVSISGPLAIIGAEQNENDLGSHAGAAYVFRQDDNWIQEAKIFTSDGRAGDRVGSAVAIDGDTAIVGAYGKAIPPYAGVGAAYVFRYADGAWVQGAKLFPSDWTAWNWRFGWAVALSGHVGLVGAPGRSLGGSPNGAAYFFGGLSECNANERLDICDIGSGASVDQNGNGLPDECDPDPGDFDGDGDVDLDDHAVFADCLSGPDVSTPPPGCTQEEFDLADMQGDNDVDLFDFGQFCEAFSP
ncbi:MAG: hypothetical protein GY778_06570 [bacterium]|nr:hypothetical protein [bacterium]